MSGKIAGIDADPRGSAPAEAESGSSPSLVELVAEAAAGAARDALERHWPGSGSAGPYVMARALWVAMNLLLGARSDRHFVVFLAGQYLEDSDL